MAGHMGAEKVSQQNLSVVRVDAERNLILVSGSIPGSKGTDVIIRTSIKSDAVLTMPDFAAAAESENDKAAGTDISDQAGVETVSEISSDESTAKPSAEEA